MRPLALSLFCLLCGVYFLTYAGDRVSNDGNYLFDSTESFVNRGQFDISYHYDLLGANQATPADPLPGAQHEPLQPILAAGLYQLAQVVPGIGIVHTVYLFNIFVTALTAVLIMVGARSFGLSLWAAWGAGLIFGLATAAWPYSRTFFREPLAGAFLLVTFLAARQGRYGLVGLGILALLLTKSVLAIALPGVLLVAIPRQVRLTFRLVGIGVGAFVLMAVGLLALGTLANIPRFSLSFVRIVIAGMEWQYIVEGLVGYTLSPGRSLFLFSPVLLLAIPGSATLWRTGERRLVVGIWGAVLLIILSYGAGRDALWWGGNSWGPRHMVPLIPTLFLLALPAIDGLLRLGRRGRITLGALLVVSVAVQVLGSTVAISTHYAALRENGVLVWDGGIWQIQWSPIVGHAQAFDLRALDVAWAYAIQPVTAVLGLCGLVITAAGVMAWQRHRLPAVAYTVVPLLLVIMFVAGLLALRHDPRYDLNSPDVPPLLETLNAETDDDDLILLQATVYQRTLMNSLRSGASVVGLPYAPGENFNPAVDPAQMRTQPPAELIDPDTITVAAWGASEFDRLWLIVDAGALDPDELRPTERYLNQQYYPLREIEISRSTRLLEYLALPASPVTGDGGPVLGGVLQLAAVDLPLGTAYQAGEPVPIGLVWEAVRRMTTDYLVSVQIRRADGMPVVQWDGRPQNGFGQTSTWEPGTRYPEQYGLILPDDLPAGEYVFQIIVYTYPELERLATVDGIDVLELATLSVR
jgi:hypothetical protein